MLFFTLQYKERSSCESSTVEQWFFFSFPARHCSIFSWLAFSFGKSFTTYFRHMYPECIAKYRVSRLAEMSVERDCLLSTLFTTTVILRELIPVWSITCSAPSSAPAPKHQYSAAYFVHGAICKLFVVVDHARAMPTPRSAWHHFRIDNEEQGVDKLKRARQKHLTQRVIVATWAWFWTCAE